MEQIWHKLYQAAKTVQREWEKEFLRLCQVKKTGAIHGACDELMFQFMYDSYKGIEVLLVYWAIRNCADTQLG